MSSMLQAVLNRVTQPLASTVLGARRQRHDVRTCRKRRRLKEAAELDACEELGGSTDANYVTYTDEQKGRGLRAIRSIAPGTAAVRDWPFVCASWDPERCLHCTDTSHNVEHCPSAKNLYPAHALANGALDKAAAAMTKLPEVEDLDRARTLLQALWRLHKEKESGNDKSSNSKLDLLVNVLTKSKMKESLADAEFIVKKFASLLPPNTSAKLVAMVLSALNTNCHTLPDELCGSGLYFTALIVEHSCRPNCMSNARSMNTGMIPNEIVFTAVQRVPSGEAISIDYEIPGTSFYQDVATRRRHIKEAYDFECVCRGCTDMPDRTRPFSCCKRGCVDGVVCPISTSTSPKDWKCLVCKSVQSEAHVKRCLDAERVIIESPPKTVHDVDAIVGRGIIQEGHYICYTKLKEHAHKTAANTLKCKDGTAERLWLRVMSCADKILAKYHGDRVVFLDTLAQIRIKAGDMEGAVRAWHRAFRISCISHGEESDITQVMEELFQDPPTDQASMEGRVLARGEDGDSANDDSDDASDESFTDVHDLD